MHSTDIRQIHSVEIFYAVLTAPGISQKELVNVTGFDKSTVSLVVNKLQKNGIVEAYKGSSNGQRGRPKSQLRISNDRGLLVGVHFEFEKMTLVATSIGGHVFGTSQSKLPEDPGSVGKRVGDSLRELCTSLGKGIQDIDSIGIAMPGQVSHGRELIQSANLHWNNVPLLEQLEAHIDVPLAVCNDTHAAALSEHFFGCAVGINDFVFIIAGLGVGGAIFLGGNLLRGADGFAGEIGHTKVVTDGRECHCGAHGCLAAYLTLEALQASAAEIDASIRSVDKFEKAIEMGNPAAVETLKEAGSLAGLAIANVINTLNPPNIVVAGTLSKYWKIMESEVLRAVEGHALQAPFSSSEIIVCDTSYSVVPRGGVAVALERHVQIKGAI